MKSGIRYIFLIITAWLHVFGHAQDVTFSQFYTNPLYLNPAFAGATGVPRVSVQYRDQWHGFDNAYTTYSAAIDFPVRSLQGGIGLHLINDTQGSGLLSNIQMNLSYAVYVRLSRTFRLHGGLQAGYFQNSLNTSKLIFSDNLDMNYGNHGTTAEIFSDPEYAFADFSAGLLAFSEKVFFGGAVHHITEPMQTYHSGTDKNNILYRKYTLHLGAQLPVFRHGHLRKKYDVSPQLIIQKQGISEQINYGMFATWHGFTAGTWFRQNFGIRYDAVIILVGFVNHRMQITYSYDMTVSGLWGDSGGTSEISLSFLLREISKKRNLPFFTPYDERFGIQ